MKILDYETELRVLEETIKRQARADSVLRIVEAGCGREWYFKLHGIAHEVTGIDLDVHALEYRRREKRDLHHGIAGDLRTVALPAAHFDVVYCSFVLEHIKGAQQALDNFMNWLKPDGLLIVRVPDVTGVQTFLARRLPRWCAILYYRSAWGIKDAGKPGFAPYPAYYDDVISPSGFHAYCESKNLELVDEFGLGSYSARGRGPLRHGLALAARLVSILSGGKIHDRFVDRTFIVRKTPVAPASQPDELAAREPFLADAGHMTPDVRPSGLQATPGT
ncbi:MAG TPA: class I SAM-dependent methyltransferase [Pseudolabrys sp.]|jgi:SAM-dependent methyltransferase|nr:class I SAM-dependent methyltransferase [Pseudolabrys sp.]